jgi:transcription initiation factor TFIIIB Brf1 subunit/transcription initiation factor TFIIB
MSWNDFNNIVNLVNQDRISRSPNSLDTIRKDSVRDEMSANTNVDDTDLDTKTYLKESNHSENKNDIPQENQFDSLLQDVDVCAYDYTEMMNKVSSEHRVRRKGRKPKAKEEEIEVEKVITSSKNKKIRIKFVYKKSQKKPEVKPKIVKKYRKKQLDEDECFFCHEKSVIYDNEESTNICTQCGKQQGMVIEHGAEWRYYGSEDGKRSSDPARCGDPTNSLLSGALSTRVNCYNNRSYLKMHTWLASNSEDRRRLKVHHKLIDKGEAANIPVCVTEKASNMYKVVSQSKMGRKGSLQGNIAASHYYAHKSKNLFRSAKEIAKLYDISTRKMNISQKTFDESLYHANPDYVIKNIHPTGASEYVRRFAIKLQLNQLTVRNAVCIASTVEKFGIASKNAPESIAASTIVFVSKSMGEEIDRNVIVEQCEITKITIAKALREIESFSDLLLNLMVDS